MAKKIRFNKAYQQLEFTEVLQNKFYEEINEAIENEKDFMEKTINALKRISNHCLILLEDIFFNKKTIEEIQIDFGYTNKHNAQN